MVPIGNPSKEAAETRGILKHRIFQLVLEYARRKTFASVFWRGNTVSSSSGGGRAANHCREHDA
jgi:hypothetical protein